MIIFHDFWPKMAKCAFFFLKLKEDEIKTHGLGRALFHLFCPPITDKYISQMKLCRNICIAIPELERQTNKTIVNGFNSAFLHTKLLTINVLREEKSSNEIDYTRISRVDKDVSYEWP